MLKSFSSADETRHHAHLKKFIGQIGTVESFTLNETQTFVFVRLKTEKILVPLYGGLRFKPQIGDTVRLGLGQQFETDDKRVIYYLVARPLHGSSN